MTELLVTPKSLSHMETLIDLGADAFVIGEQKFGLRLPLCKISQYDYDNKINQPSQLIIILPTN